MRRELMLALAITMSVAACGGKDEGPGLPACSRSAGSSGCTATWRGAAGGSVTCTQTTWGTEPWSFTLDGPVANQLIVSLSLPSTPAPGQSFAMNQTNNNPVIQLSDGNAWWGATHNIGGDFLLHVDEVVSGSGYIHGSLAGSLVRGSGGSDSGVQICITF